MRSVCLHIKNIANKGGEERMCATLANGLVDRGYNVIVVSYCTPYSEKSFFPLSSDIKVYKLLGNKIERNIWRLPLGQNYHVWKLKWILKSNKIDVVIDVDIRQSLITSKAVGHSNIKIISWDHFDYVAFTKRRRKAQLLDCFRRNVDKLVVLTKSNRNLFINNDFLPESLVVNIPNPSPIINDEPWYEHNSKKVLSVGRLETQKGFDLLLMAWQIVEVKAPDWQLEIVGDGACKPLYERMITDLGLKHVTISPFTNKIKEKYKNADIYVLPSRTEGFGLVLVEAETMGLPLVAFDCGGPKEIIINGENGFLVEPENFLALSFSILHLISNDELRVKMSKNAFEHSILYNKDTIFRQWTALIDSL